MKTGPWPPLETTWEDWLLGGGPRAAFADPTLPLEVEIGPGEDDFLLESAAGAPRPQLARDRVQPQACPSLRPANEGSGG